MGPWAPENQPEGMRSGEISLPLAGYGIQVIWSCPSLGNAGELALVM